MEDIEKERADLIRQGQLLENQLKVLRARLEQLTLALLQIEKAKASATAVERGKEMLLPIGADVLIEATAKSESFYLPVGAGYYIKVGKDKIVDKMELLERKIREEYDKINEEVKKAEDKLVGLIRQYQEYETYKSMKK